MRPSPTRCELAGDSEAAAARWEALGLPYEAALALADADDEAPARRARTELQELGARPAAAIVARRLRARGARGLPPRAAPAHDAREPGAAHRARARGAGAGRRGAAQRARSPSGCSSRPRRSTTTSSAILRKLGARTRGEAAAAARRLGLVPEHD